MFNFFEIFMSAEYFRSNYGNPSWVNTTAGPGLGTSALTMFASLHGADLVSYDEGKDKTRLVHLGELNELLQCSKKFKGLLGELCQHDSRTMEDICSKIGISKSTASRQLKTLHNLGLIDVSGSGRGRSPFNISLTVWGKQFCQYSGCY
jgi:DNA-binding MarR family transcriptional regulator